MATLNTHGFDWSTPRFSPQQVTTMMHPDMPHDQLLLPTPEQDAVIRSGADPLLVVAGAGSGKTHTMTDRVIWLIANGFVAPEEVLGVTFTRKAAGELEARINAAIRQLATLPDTGLDLDPDDLAQATISTYHSYANMLVADHGLRIGVEPDARLIGQAQSVQIITQIVNESEHDVSLITAAKTTVIKSVLQLASECAEHGVTPDQVRDFIRTVGEEKLKKPGDDSSNPDTRGVASMLAEREVLADLVETYLETKKRLNVMDYGDLVMHASTIAQQIPEVAELERQRFKIVLLDEFQDTSHAQLELFAGLFAADEQRGLGPHPVTAVGDPNQSIYGFRGASAGQLAQFTTRFKAMDPNTGDDEAPRLINSSQLTLSTAWRNGRQILDAANHVSMPLRGSAARFGTAPQVNIPELEPAPQAIAGQVVTNWFDNDEAEAEALAQTLIDELDIDPHAQDPGGNGDTAAVLVRVKSAIEPIAAAMEAAGVPYEVVGVAGLLSQPEVIDVLSYLQVISDPNRADALLRILTGPEFRLAPADLWVLNQHASQLANRGKATLNKDDSGSVPERDVESVSLIEAVLTLPDADWTTRTGQRISPAGRQRLNLAAERIKYLSRSHNASISNMIRTVIRVSGIDVELGAKPLVSQASSLDNLSALIDLAEDFDAEIIPGQGDELSAFLAWLEAAEEEEGGLDLPVEEPRPGAVQILTLHASKGLEWDVVAIPNMADGTFPTNKADLWTRPGNGQLPWDLRGDASTLPRWDFRQGEDRKEWAKMAVGKFTEKQAEDGAPLTFQVEVKAHTEYEERRLAYVGLTRAKRKLWLSGASFTSTAVRPKSPSKFLTDLEDHPAVTQSEWADISALPKENPDSNRILSTTWPYDPLEGPQIYSSSDHDDLVRAPAAADGELLPSHNRGRREDVEKAAGWVKDASAQLDDIADEQLRDQIRWILARRGLGPQRVDLTPQHLSTTGFVEMQADPNKFYEDLARPMPRKPSKAARKGTQMHTWIEEFYAQQAPGKTQPFNIDVAEELMDEDFETELGLPELKEAFRNSEWAQKVPFRIEQQVETSVRGITLRGKIDAIFRTGGDPDVEFDPDASWELIDWKSGAVPRNDQELQTKSLQLAIYRLAWSRLHDIPLENISGRFVYLTHGVERGPEDMDLADEAELERLLVEAMQTQKVSNQTAGE